MIDRNKVFFTAFIEMDFFFHSVPMNEFFSRRLPKLVFFTAF